MEYQLVILVGSDVKEEYIMSITSLAKELGISLLLIGDGSKEITPKDLTQIQKTNEKTIFIVLGHGLNKETKEGKKHHTIQGYTFLRTPTLINAIQEQVKHPAFFILGSCYGGTTVKTGEISPSICLLTLASGKYPTNLPDSINSVLDVITLKSKDVPNIDIFATLAATNVETEHFKPFGDGHIKLSRAGKIELKEALSFIEEKSKIREALIESKKEDFSIPKIKKISKENYTTDLDDILTVFLTKKSSEENIAKYLQERSKIIGHARTELLAYKKINFQEELLKVAIIRGAYDMVLALMKAGVNIRNQPFFTYVADRIKRGDDMVVVAELFLKHPELDIYQVNEKGNNAMAIIIDGCNNSNDKIKKSYQKVLNMILSSSLDLRKFVDDGILDPFAEAYYGRYESLKLLIEKFPEIVNKVDGEGETPLKVAIDQGEEEHLKIVKLLLDNNATINEEIVEYAKSKMEEDPSSSRNNIFELLQSKFVEKKQPTKTPKIDKKDKEKRIVKQKKDKCVIL